MTSFLSRIAIDATSALNDAYSHVMHGDDAGSSAKVVWVVHPTRVPSEIGMGSDGVGRFTHKFGEIYAFPYILFVQVVLIRTPQLTPYFISINTTRFGIDIP